MILWLCGKFPLNLRARSHIFPIGNHFANTFSRIPKYDFPHCNNTKLGHPITASCGPKVLATPRCPWAFDRTHVGSIRVPHSNMGPILVLCWYVGRVADANFRRWHVPHFVPMRGRPCTLCPFKSCLVGYFSISPISPDALTNVFRPVAHPSMYSCAYA